MIRYSLYFFLICHLFVLNHAEPLLGEQVWPANPENWTFIASLGMKNPTPFGARSHFCGGSLITKQHVLTAAHCLDEYTEDEVDVIVGEADLRLARFRYDVDGWITYNSWAHAHGRPVEFSRNDIAIVKLKSTVDRPGIKPIVISESNDVQVYGKGAVMAGWGTTNNGTLANELLSARVKIWTIGECRCKLKTFSNKRTFVGENYLCSSAVPYALSGCGDSGGPLLGQNNVLLGIVRSTCPENSQQWGDFSPELLNHFKVNLHPSVHYYRDFIESVTNLVTRPRA